MKMLEKPNPIYYIHHAHCLITIFHLIKNCKTEKCEYVII